MLVSVEKQVSDWLHRRSQEFVLGHSVKFFLGVELAMAPMRVGRVGVAFPENVFRVQSQNGEFRCILSR